MGQSQQKLLRDASGEAHTALLASPEETLDEMREYFKGRFFGQSDIIGLLVAAVIAAVGLATNSSVSVVASMLVSPLMNPVLRISYALADPVIRVRKRSVFSLCLGITICIAVGIIVGLLGHYLKIARDWNWPTEEMKSRYESRALLPGLIIAVASGIGAANAVQHVATKKAVRQNDLVGVAISAALLPPLVNSGMILSYGLVQKDMDDWQASEHAGTSFFLTAMNILSILVTATLVFKYRISHIAARIEANISLDARQDEWFYPF